MPLRRNAKTVKSAVHSMSWDVTNSPIGTAKNKNPNGKIISRVTDQPKTAGTANTSSATNTNWVIALTATKSANSHTKAAHATNKNILGAGCGICAVRRWRRRHINHNTIGGTKNAWVKVSDRAQIVTMAVPVSWYKNKIHASKKPKAGKARCQGCAKRGLFLAML